MDGPYLRALARCCRDLSNECFDLTVAGKLRRLSDSIGAKAQEVERGGRPGVRLRSGLGAVGRWMRQLRLVAWERDQDRPDAHGVRH